jgi:hypothetical protein
MKKIILLSIALLLTTSSCSMYETMVNLSRLKFKLGDVVNFTVGGINITNKRSVSDFSSVEVLKLTSALTSGKLPASFTLNVEAKNPNDGTGGYPSTNVSLSSSKELPMLKKFLIISIIISFLASKKLLGLGSFKSIGEIWGGLSGNTRDIDQSSEEKLFVE